MNEKQVIKNFIWFMGLIVVLIIVEFGFVWLFSTNFENKWVMMCGGFISGIIDGCIVAFVWDRLED